MQEKGNAPSDKQPKGTKKGRQKRSKPQPRKLSPERILKVLKSKRSAPEGKQQIPPPKPILHIHWAREANDADHREGAPVDWVHEGRDDDKRGEDDVCHAPASVVEGIGHPPRPTA